MSRYAIQAISLNGTQRPGITGYGLSRSRTWDSSGSDGVVHETAHHELRREDMADLTTRDLAMLTILNGSTDLPLLAFTSGGLVLYGAQAEGSAPGFASGSVHQTRTVAAGLLHFQSLSWSPGQKAELAMRALAKSTDGVTDPIALGTAALPTQPVPDYGYVLTAATVAGSSIARVNSVQISVDPLFEYDFNLGLPYPVDILGAGVTGRLAVRAAVDIGELSLGSGSGACSFQFTKLASGGGLSSTTMTLTLNGAYGIVENETGSDGSRMSRSLEVRSTYNGTTKPLTWAAA